MPWRSPQGKGGGGWLSRHFGQCFVAHLCHVGYSTLKFAYCQIVFECDFKEVVDDVERGHNGDFITADNASALFDGGTFFVEHINGLEQGIFFLARGVDGEIDIHDVEADLFDTHGVSL